MRKVFMFLLAAALFSCGRTVSEDGAEKAFVWEHPRTDASLLPEGARIEYVALESDPAKGFSGNVSKITYSGGNFFVLDGHGMGSRLIVFDSLGAVRSVIDRRGNGPGEYVTMDDFSVRGDTVYVLDGSKDAVLQYDIKGNHLRTGKLGIPTLSALAATDYGFLAYRQRYTADDYDGGHAVYRLDRNFEIQERYLPYGPDAPMLRYETPFVETDDFVVFGQMLWSSVAVFDRRAPGMKRYTVDFGDHAIPEKYMPQTERVFGEQERFAFFVTPPLPVGDALVGKVSDRGRLLNYRLDMASGTIAVDKGDELPRGPACFSRVGEQALVTWLDAYQYENNGYKPGLPGPYEAHLEDGGVVLMIVRWS